MNKDVTKNCRYSLLSSIWTTFVSVDVFGLYVGGWGSWRISDPGWCTRHDEAQNPFKLRCFSLRLSESFLESTYFILRHSARCLHPFPPSMHHVWCQWMHAAKPTRTCTLATQGFLWALSPNNRVQICVFHVCSSCFSCCSDVILVLLLIGFDLQTLWLLLRLLLLLLLPLLWDAKTQVCRGLGYVGLLLVVAVVCCLSVVICCLFVSLLFCFLLLCLFVCSFGFLLICFLFLWGFFIDLFVVFFGWNY